MPAEGNIAPAILDRARSLRAAGAIWAEVVAKCGVSYDRLRGALDPEFHEHRRNRINARRREREFGKRPPRSEHRAERPISASQAKAMMATIPHDTRSFTARAMGDPLPGRSALDQKQKFSTGCSGDNSTLFVAAQKPCVLMEDRHSNSEAVK